MKPTIAAITLLMVAAICSFAFAQKDAARPAGIPASQWVPLGDRLGIVISDYQPGDALKTPQSLFRTIPAPALPAPGQVSPTVRELHAPAPPASESMDSARPYMDGYFMVKQNGLWTRLSVVPPPQLLRNAE